MLAEWLPIVNLGLGCVGFVWLLLRTALRRYEYPDEILLTLAMTIALFFGLLGVSAEMLDRENIPIHLALFIATIKTFALVVLYLTRSTKYRTGTRTFDGNPGADQNRDIA